MDSDQDLSAILDRRNILHPRPHAHQSVDTDLLPPRLPVSRLSHHRQHGTRIRCPHWHRDPLMSTSAMSSRAIQLGQIDPTRQMHQRQRLDLRPRRHQYISRHIDPRFTGPLDLTPQTSAPPEDRPGHHVPSRCIRMRHCHGATTFPRRVRWHEFDRPIVGKCPLHNVDCRRDELRNHLQLSASHKGSL